MSTNDNRRNDEHDDACMCAFCMQYCNRCFQSHDKCDCHIDDAANIRESDQQVQQNDDVIDRSGEGLYTWADTEDFMPGDQQ